MALRELRAAEVELLARLSQIRKALSVLGEPEADAALKRPQCRADLLREYLLDKPGGVRVKNVPAILKAMGHSSFAAQETLNWLSPSQLPPGKNYFIRKRGIITLRPEFNPALGAGSKNPAQAAPLSTSQTVSQGEPANGTRSPEGGNGAGSIYSVNRCCNSLVGRYLDANPC